MDRPSYGLADGSESSTYADLAASFHPLLDTAYYLYSFYTLAAQFSYAYTLHEYDSWQNQAPPHGRRR